MGAAPQHRWRTVSRETVAAPIRLYGAISRTVLPRRCKFEPTCSSYAVTAIRTRGVVVGVMLAAWRILRCNPWSLGGVDPVPLPPCRRSRPTSSAPTIR